MTIEEIAVIVDSVPKKKKIILFELNEVPWKVIRDFVDQFPESVLAKHFSKMQKYETYSEDDELSPWATWPSVHRGVFDQKHTITNFGQDLDLINEEFPNIWDITVRNGVSTGVFGSFHTYPLPDNAEDYDFYVPDVFAAGSECFPKSIEAFQDWQLKMSRASGRTISKGLPLAATMKFLANMPQLGFKAGTLASVGKQLMDERRENWKKIRRRTFQVVLAFDVFAKYLAKSKPRFATFYTNHVASSMHRYWAAKYPDHYEVNTYSDDWKSTYQHEIDWTMGEFDKLLGRLVHFATKNPEYQVWIASSMGQAATVADNQVSSQMYLTDLPKFMGKFGFHEGSFDTRPAMLPRITVVLKDKSRSKELVEATANIVFPPDHPMGIQDLGHGVFKFRTPILQDYMEPNVIVNGKAEPMAAYGFGNCPIDDKAGQSAYHIREGSLLVFDPDSPVQSDDPKKILATDICPMILRNFGIRRPEHMSIEGN